MEHGRVYAPPEVDEAAFSYRDVPGECDVLTAVYQMATGCPPASVLELACGPVVLLRRPRPTAPGGAVLEAGREMLPRHRCLLGCKRAGVQVRTESGPQWVVRHEVSWEVQFILWLRRRLGSGAGLTEGQWWDWIDRMVGGRGTASAHVVVMATAPNEQLRTASAERWSPFAREWEPQRQHLEQQIGALGMDPAVLAHVHRVMGNSDDELILIQTDEPGTMCRQVGQLWLLGQAYLAPDAFCRLVERLRE